MAELIRIIVSIKDPLTLLAFFAVVLLIAFRTEKVPELLFRLLGEKISRERFYTLLNRALLYSFGVFIVLGGIAVLSQVLNYKTVARAATIDELTRELERSEASASAAQSAIAEYQKALTLSQNDRLGDAIASLEASLKAVPTATARETLALLYQKAGNRDEAVKVAEQAVSQARESGDAVRTAKAERLLASVSTPIQQQHALQSCPPGAGLVGAKLNLPPGGDDFETASALVPCVYSGQFDVKGSPKYYKVALERGQTLSVVLRTRGADAATTTVGLHRPDGGSLGGYTAYGDSSVTQPLEYKADSASAAFISLAGGVRGSAVAVSVR